MITTQDPKSTKVAGKNECRPARIPNQKEKRNDDQKGEVDQMSEVYTTSNTFGARSSTVNEKKSASLVAIEYSCNECGAEFEIFRDLAKHKRAAQCRGEEIEDVWTRWEKPIEEAAENALQCPHCNKSFKFPWECKRHIRRHTGKKPFKCHHCDRSFYEHAELLRHIRVAHGATPYECKVCGETFEMCAGLAQHKKTKHKPTDLYGVKHQCEQCERSFYCASGLAIHLRRHTGEKPFACNQCVATFAENAELKRHLRKNHGAKPYGCEICSESFEKQKQFTQHKVTAHKGAHSYYLSVLSRRLASDAKQIEA